MKKYFTKRIILLFLSLFIVKSGFAQLLSGTINVGTGQTYTTLTGSSGGLFNAINNGTITGDITVQITSDITEPGNVTLNRWAESGIGNYQIRIVPDGTIERVISGSGANMINLSNVRNVVIDGSFSGTGKFLRFTNTNKGANTLAFLNDCKSDTVTNCYFEGVDTTTNKSVILIGTTNIAGGTGNDSIAILNNIIKDNAAGYPKNLIRSVGTASAPNDNCIISGNEFINWSNEAMGLAAGTGDNWKILNNAFYQSPGASINTTFYVICAIANSGNGHIISGNSIGGRAADRSGASMRATNTSASPGYSIIGIFLTGSGSISKPVVVTKNRISNIGNTVSGINLVSANAIVDSNIIDNFALSYFSYDESQNLSGISLNSSNVTITNNTIRKFYQDGWGFVAPSVVGILGSGPGTYIIDGNVIDSILAAYSSQNPNYANNPVPCGISIYLSGAATTNKISNNKISNIINTNYFSATGIRYSSTNTSATNIFNNQIDNVGGLLYNSGNPSNFLIGIQESGGGNDTIYNNIINIGALSNSVTSIYGIRNGANNGTHVYYNNTVNITGSAQSGRTSSAFSKSLAGGNVLLRNNVFKNSRISTGSSARSYAIEIENTTGFNSDYNLIFAADASCTAWGTSPLNFSGWKTSSNGDTNSVNAPVTFVSATDLHIDGTNANAWNVYGRGIAIPTINTDIDNDPRSATVGIPVTIGADEIAMPSSIPPNMVMTPSTPTAGTPTVFTSAGRRIAEITWTGGVAPGTITGKYYPGVPAPNTMTTPNSNSYFELTPDVTTGIPYTIKTYYTEAEAAGIPDANLWGMKSHTTGVWTGTTYANANATDAYGKYLQSWPLNDFSSFSMTGNATPLAIDLKTIAAKNVGNKNRVDWSTAKETKADYFELESSTDARNFKKIAKVNANGQASVYTYWDEKAVLGMNYYRLKMTMDNGSFVYSKTVSAEVRSLSGFAISAYPNPVKNKVALKIDGSIQDNALITLMDVTGKLLQTIEVPGNELEINMNNLATGIYFIKYNDEQQEQTIKITKQ